MKPKADIDRIAHFARKPLPARVQAEVDKLADSFREVQLARAIEGLVRWAYEQGCKDGHKQ